MSVTHSPLLEQQTSPCRATSYCLLLLLHLFSTISPLLPSSLCALTPKWTAVHLVRAQPGRQNTEQQQGKRAEEVKVTWKNGRCLKTRGWVRWLLVHVMVNEMRVVKMDHFKRPEWWKLWSEERLNECNLALGCSWECTDEIEWDCEI